MKKPRANHCLCGIVVILGCISATAFADWVKPTSDSSPVPDVDKDVLDRTCWLATAANMLGAAGYGTEDTAQDRAETIYDQLRVNYPPVE